MKLVDDREQNRNIWLTEQEHEFANNRFMLYKQNELKTIGTALNRDLRFGKGEGNMCEWNSISLLSDVGGSSSVCVLIG